MLLHLRALGDAAVGLSALARVDVDDDLDLLAGTAALRRILARVQVREVVLPSR